MERRTATSIHVALTPDAVTQALQQPGFLAALDARLADASIQTGTDGITVQAQDGPAWDLRVREEGGGARVVIGERGSGPRRLGDLINPTAQVDRLEEDAARLRSMLEAMALFDRRA